MTKVTLRMKPISGSRQTLSLDYYPPIPHPVTGKLPRREFLKLYTYDKAKNEPDKRHNKETLVLAETIRAQRQIAVQKANYGFLSDEKQMLTLSSILKIWQRNVPEVTLIIGFLL